MFYLRVEFVCCRLCGLSRKFNIFKKILLLNCNNNNARQTTTQPNNIHYKHTRAAEIT